MYLPELQPIPQSRVMTSGFGGYNHNLKILPGEWYDMENMTSSYAPLLAQRGRRGVMRTLENPLGLAGKDALLHIDGATVYYNGAAVSGVTLSTNEAMLPKQIVSMGAYAVIFPDGKYINTANLTDVGSINALYESVEDAPIAYSLSRADGEEYDLSGATTGEVAPDDPENGDYWIDTSADVHVLRQYSASMSMWSSVPTSYVRISATGIGEGFEQGDGVEISGCVYSGDSPAMGDQISALNATAVVQSRGADWIVVIGFIDLVYTQESGKIKVSRTAPRMDYVIESGNRLWGCRYGMQDGETLNEIYACKLGDFKNWSVYAGISTDSYRVSVGSDGVFTGAVSYQGKPTFFKEDIMHRVYGGAPSSFQMQTTACRGVQAGSWRSLAVVDEYLYYKARQGVVVYDGSLPQAFSDAFGDVSYFDAVGGALGSKYYVSMRDGAGAWHLFVYDRVRGAWHREDATRALCFATTRGEIYYIDATTKNLISATGAEGTPEGVVNWRVDSGLMGYELPDKKYVSRINIRASLGVGAELTVLFEYNSSGEWSDMGTCKGAMLTDTITLPVMPRRCDHFRMRLSGKGEARVYSIARILEEGGDA